MNYLTDPAAMREAIAPLVRAKTLWLDTEVADYNSAKPRLSLIQILDDSTDLSGDRVLILDVLEYPEVVADFIDKVMANPQIEKVFHNASFDKKLLGKNKCKHLTCTLEMVRQIPYYLVPLPNFRLKTLARELCFFSVVDESEQQGDWGRRPLRESQLQYAKMDPVYVAHVHHRLLQIGQSIAPDPHTEDLDSLIDRYREIESQWKQLDTEVQHLKERLKAAMNAQQRSQLRGFKLIPQQRVTRKVQLSALMELLQTHDLELDFPLTLTKDMQTQLGEFSDRVPTEEKVSQSYQLREIDPDLEEDDLPF